MQAQEQTSWQSILQELARQNEQNQQQDQQTTSSMNRILVFIWFIIIMTLPCLTFSLVFPLLRGQLSHTCPGNPKYADISYTVIPLANVNISKIRIEGSGAVYIRANKTDKIHIELVRQSNNLLLLGSQAIWDVRESDGEVSIRHYPYGNSHYNNTDCVIVSRYITLPYSLLRTNAIDLYVTIRGSKYYKIDEPININMYSMVNRKIEFANLFLLNENGPISVHDTKIQTLIATTESASSYISINKTSIDLARITSSDHVLAENSNISTSWINGSEGNILISVCAIREMNTFSNHSVTFLDFNRNACFNGNISLHSEIGIAKIFSPSFNGITESNNIQGSIGNISGSIILSNSVSGSIIVSSP